MPLWETVRSGDPEWAHQFLAREYAEHRVELLGNEAGFEFSHRRVRGDDRFSIARIGYSLAVLASVEPVAAVLVVQVHRGRLSVRAGERRDDFGPGELFVYPPGRPVSVSCDQFRLTVVRFDPQPLARYAASIVTADSSGLGVTPLATGRSSGPDWRSLFVGWRPVSAGMARYWRATLRHVLTEVLADPELAEDPVVLDAAYRQLAAAALATFAPTPTPIPTPAPAPRR